MKAAVGLGLLTMSGCGTSYLYQAAAGQMNVLRARMPLEQVLADPGTPPEVRRQLLIADSALVFARTSLGLPKSGSYRHYANLGRPYVLWNVAAAPEFALVAREVCYPIAGCVAYQGYFAEQDARAAAARLAAQGYDVDVGGVPAYATLGWFDDPLMNTMLNRSDNWLAGLIFHELAHLLIYVPGDTSFNEGFASFVELEGKRRWLRSRGDQAGLLQLERREQREAEVGRILDELRLTLGRIYARNEPDELKRRNKADAIQAARNQYAELRSTWTGPPWFDERFGPGLNNASLVALETYLEYVPAFAALLLEVDGDLERFYARARELARLDENERHQRLVELAAGVPAVALVR